MPAAFMPFAKKIVPINKSLTAKYGGRWKYDASAIVWNCDDGVRSVRRGITGRDQHGELIDESSALFMYFTDGRPTERVVFE